ncbi:Putative acyl-CoA N-acyltransferase (NAT) family protein [Zea mays]|uniref:Putative acyl-CoA N-acyltransferase (NAT) family protein n=1 Tax=Zea mays TaxID=4577 RepID=A0A1D6QIS1_MAIZE|nr:Putative acyl-CoA N-acyltransferase (NAT) family protein [Zea mays]AQK57716.1 Putative acyl-CoA N-acyltransferase (NAT) family protein [Zea mays]
MSSASSSAAAANAGEGSGGAEEGVEITYVSYGGEQHLPLVMSLVDEELSEPYSIFTYRYFVYLWPQLTFLAFDARDGKCVGTVVCKMGEHRGAFRGYIAMLVVLKPYRGRGIGAVAARCLLAHPLMFQLRTFQDLWLVLSIDHFLILSISGLLFRQQELCGHLRRSKAAHLCCYSLQFQHCLGLAAVISEFDPGATTKLIVRDIRATELVTRSIRAMMESGCEEVTLEAEVTNKGALALYGRLGFIRAKRLYRYYLNGVDAFRLKLLFPRPDNDPQIFGIID